jgi:hypothetical protein
LAADEDGMNRAQASAALVGCLLFASCGGNGTKSGEATFTKRDVVKAAHLKPARGGGYLEPRSKCRVTRILTSASQVQKAASAAAPVATNPAGSAGVEVGPKKRLACLLVLRNELRRLTSPGGPVPPGAANQ